MTLDEEIDLINEDDYIHVPQMQPQHVSENTIEDWGR